MSAVLLAVYNNHDAAERVRIDLVRDGFPTDRVELTDSIEPGRAGLAPADSMRGKFQQYFQNLFCFEDERHYAETLAERVHGGAATVTVHPRGAIETARATEILGSAGPLEVAQHDLANQVMEHAAASHAQPWIRYLWVERTSSADCIYCRLFERHSH